MGLGCHDRFEVHYRDVLPGSLPRGSIHVALAIAGQSPTERSGNQFWWQYFSSCWKQLPVLRRRRGGSRLEVIRSEIIIGKPGNKIVSVV